MALCHSTVVIPGRSDIVEANSAAPCLSTVAGTLRATSMASCSAR